MNPQTAEARYQLTILNYPETRVIPQICKLIYQTEDKNLLASLSTLPYIVGRSFSPTESESLHTALRQLKVGHRFHSDNAPPLSFDPSSSAGKKPLAPSGKVIELKTRKNKFTSMTVMGGAIFILGLGVIFKITHKNGAEIPQAAEDSNFEAKIEDLSRDVEYRIAEDLIWKKAELNLSLQSKDSIRTFQDSTAKLKYREGSYVTVMPNTLMVIGKKEDQNGKLIRLEDGTVQARLKASEKPSHLSIETTSGTLEVAAPKPGDTKESKVETSISGGKLTVSVTQGQATLMPKTKNAAPVTINSLQQVTATRDSISVPTTYTPVIRLIEPSLNNRITLDPQKTSSLKFRWQALESGAEYELLLSSDPEMKEVFLKQKSSLPFVELAYVDIGKVYWQVLGVSDGIHYRSPIWQIYVQKSDN